MEDKSIAHKEDKYWLFTNRAGVTSRDWIIWGTFVFTATVDTARVLLPYIIDVDALLADLFFLFNISFSLYSLIESWSPGLLSDGVIKIFSIAGWFLDLVVIGGCLYLAIIFWPYRDVHRQLNTEIISSNHGHSDSSTDNLLISGEQTELEEKLNRLYSKYEKSDGGSKYVVKEQISDVIQKKIQLGHFLNQKEKAFLRKNSNDANSDYWFDKFLSIITVLLVLLIYFVIESG